MVNKLKNLIGICGDVAYRKYAARYRRIRKKEKYKSIDFFIEYLNHLGNNVTPNSECEKVRNRIISEICTLDSVYTSFHFSKDCACLVSDEATAKKAMDRGALVLITPKDYAKYPCLISNDPLGVFSDLCLYFRNLKKNMPITAITGSIGKTTIKNMVGEVYKMKYKTSYTQSNINTRMAVGFAVQHIPDWAEIMIQEIHEGSPNITQYVSRMLHPSTFIITPIDLSHFQYFGSKEKIEEEICSVTKYMADGSIVIVNIDDFSRFDLLEGRKIITTSTQTQKADYWAKGTIVENDGLVFSIVDNKTQKEYEIRLSNIYAPHNASCALYAFAAGMCANIPPQDIVKGLMNYRTSGERQNIFRTNNGILVYADCYNAVGKSMKSAINAASNIPTSGKRIAVLGDMAEVGSESEQMHKEITEMVNNSSFDYLFTIGSEFEKAINKVSLRKTMTVKTTQSHAELNKMILNTAKQGDLVLFKASHSSNLSDCIKTIWPKEYRHYIKPAYTEYSMWERESLRY